MNCLLEVLTSGPIDTNAILIACSKTKQAAIVDCPLEVCDLLKKRLADLQLSLKMILLTHSHWDHIADVDAIKKAFQVPVYIHQEDAENLEKPGSDGLPLYFPMQGVKPDHYLEEGRVIFLGDLKIEVIHTPGHTPGGVCFYFKEEHVLLAGDTLFRGAIGSLSLPTARSLRMWKSLKKLSELPHETKVYPGHGKETTIGREIENNNLLRYREYEK